MEHSSAWSAALRAAGDLPQPSAKAAYYFPPPWLVDRLQGYAASDTRCERYLHHWLSIRDFCRVRLFDRTIAGRPLTIAEWRHALWGEYGTEAELDARGLSPVPGPSSAVLSNRDPRQQQRHEIKEAITALFGRGGRLPCYSASSRPAVGDRTVSLEELRADATLQARLIWAVYETNWRCELLALDAIMMESASWAETARWEREALVARVWGGERSGLAVCPPDGSLQWCWASGNGPDHAPSRASLRAFVTVLQAWAGCPARLDPRALERPDEVLIADMQRLAAGFYVQTFVAKYERLPVPPVRPRGST